MVKLLQLSNFFEIGRSAHWLHLSSERRNTHCHNLHRPYGLLAFNYRIKHYIPKYFNVDVIRAIADRLNLHPVRAIQDRPLGLGATLKTFDTD